MSMDNKLTVPSFTDEDIVQPFYKIITDLIFLSYSGDINNMRNNIISDFNIEEYETEDYYEEAIKFIAKVFLKALESDHFCSIDDLNKGSAINALYLIRFSKDYNKKEKNTFNMAVMINCFQHFYAEFNRFISTQEKAELANCISNNNLSASLLMLGSDYIRYDIKPEMWGMV